MNRAEKRRSERNKSKKRFMTEEEIKKIKEEATNEAFDKLFGCLFTLPLVALKEEYGFGKKRLQRVNDKITELLKEVEVGELELNSLMDMMEKKYNIVFRSEKENK